MLKVDRLTVGGKFERDVIAIDPAQERENLWKTHEGSTIPVRRIKPLKKLKLVEFVPRKLAQEAFGGRRIQTRERVPQIIDDDNAVVRQARDDVTQHMVHDRHAWK